MSLTRSFKLVAPLGLALLAGCFAANPASAQEVFNGSFTLPFQARWGQVVLSPGEYSFTLDHGVVGGVVSIRREDRHAMGFVPTQAIYTQQTVDHSELILVRSGGTYAVRAVRMAELGLTLEYSAPKTGKQIISQAPQLLERIPVTMGG
jgi:hypothetical protein